MDEKSWDKFKASTLLSLQKAIDNREVDPMLIDFLLKINKASNIVTTSSCAGRVMILIPGEKKNETKRCFISHEPVSDDEIIAGIDACDSENTWIKIEPFIYHIVARDYETAKKLIDVAVKSGIKRVGIREIRSGRFLVETIGTNVVAFPISICQSIDVGKLAYIANSMLEKNEMRRKIFENNLISAFID